MDRFPSEFYEIFKQQLVARGINASEISMCEEQISVGKFFDLIDAIRQNDIIEEPELKSIIQAIEQKNSKPDVISNHIFDESSKFVPTMPDLEQDSENFIPNLQMPAFESLDDASDYDFSKENEEISNPQKTSDGSFNSVSDVSSSDSNELLSKIQNNSIPETEKYIVSSDDLDENSLKSAKDIQFVADQNKPKRLSISEKKQKGNITTRKTDYIAPPPAGSTRRIKSREKKNSDKKKDEKNASVRKTEEIHNIEINTK